MEKRKKKEIENLATQTSLRLTREEMESIEEDIRDLGGYLSKLEEIQPPDGETFSEEGYWLHKNKTPLRKDIPEDFDQRELLRGNFPKRREDFLVVPKVVKMKEKSIQKKGE